MIFRQTRSNLRIREKQYLSIITIAQLLHYSDYWAQKFTSVMFPPLLANFFDNVSRNSCFKPWLNDDMFSETYLLLACFLNFFPVWPCEKHFASEKQSMFLQDSRKKSCFLATWKQYYTCFPMRFNFQTV